MVFTSRNSAQSTYSLLYFVQFVRTKFQVLKAIHRIQTAKTSLKNVQTYPDEDGELGGLSPTKAKMSKTCIL